MNLKMVFICSINVCNKNIVIMARTFLFVLVISSLNSDAWVEDGLQSVIKSLKTNSSNFWHTSTVCVCLLLAVGNNWLWNPRWMRLDSHRITFATCFDNIARLNWTALITTLSSSAVGDGGLGSHKQDGTLASKQSSFHPSLFENQNTKPPKIPGSMTQAVEFTKCHQFYWILKTYMKGFSLQTLWSCYRL